MNPPMEIKTPVKRLSFVIRRRGEQSRSAMDLRSPVAFEEFGLYLSYWTWLLMETLGRATMIRLQCSDCELEEKRKGQGEGIGEMRRKDVILAPAFV